MTRPTYAEVDLNAIKQNVIGIRNRLPKNTIICAVVKADGYGHGSLQAARAAIAGGAEWLALAIPEECIPLRDAGINVPMLVMGGITREQAGLSVDLNLDQCVFTKDIICVLEKEAEKRGKTSRVHIKADTGMGRIGIRTAKELKELLSCIKKCPKVELAGFFTHFSVSDAYDKSYTLEQNEKFKEFINIVRAEGFDPIVHASNSAAVIDMPELSYDMVRPGISIYGLYPSDEVDRQKVKLKPALRIVSHIAYVKEAGEGQYISYGRAYKTSGKTVIATLPIGYGDGLRRLLSNRGEVLIRGKRAKITGRVCMDQTMVDVTDIPNAGAGDEAVIIGKQGEDEITADEMAKMLDTINYEVVLSFLPRVERVYTGGDLL